MDIARPDINEKKKKKRQRIVWTAAAVV